MLTNTSTKHKFAFFTIFEHRRGELGCWHLSTYFGWLYVFTHFRRQLVYGCSLISVALSDESRFAFHSFFNYHLRSFSLYCSGDFKFRPFAREVRVYRVCTFRGISALKEGKEFKTISKNRGTVLNKGITEKINPIKSKLTRKRTSYGDGNSKLQSNQTIYMYGLSRSFFFLLLLFPLLLLTYWLSKKFFFVAEYSLIYAFHFQTVRCTTGNFHRRTPCFKTPDNEQLER